MKRKHIRLVVLLGALLIFAGAAVAQKPKAQAVDTAKVQLFLKKSRYKVTKVDGDIWSVQNGNFSAVVAVGPPNVIIFLIIADKKEFNATAESLAEMLRVAGNVDYVKLVLDKDDSLVLRTETKVASLTQKDFDQLVDQIFAVTDLTLQKLEPYLIK